MRFFIGPIPTLIFITLFYFPATSFAQKNTQETVKKQAATYFEQDDLTDAYQLYGQLLSISPHDPTYNYRFGACLLYTDADKKRAIKYIRYAIKQPNVDNLAYYFLGRALHLNYEFDEAIKYYHKFEQGASSSELKKYPVSQLVEMCENGKQLLVYPQELDVLRKKQLGVSIFFEAYSMHSNGGVIIAEPEEFKTKLDKKKNLTGLMYLTADRTIAFFSSYGDNESNGKDIYEIKKKMDGTWGAAVNLGNVINTPYDEDYPVYDASRNTLYFSSKGHNSMGGYDIFSSVYNDTSGTWSLPANMEFPINTPDDDFLFVPDTLNQTAFFASTRLSPQGKANVYKIALHLHPPASQLVAGTVHKEGSDAAEYSIITVRDSATNKVVAVDTTSAQDGSYSFRLPQGGKYTFTVQDSTHPGVSQSVYLAQAEAKIALEQNIAFNSKGGLTINSRPVAKSSDTSSHLQLQYIQNLANMDVNVDTNSIQPLLAQKASVYNPNENATTSPVANNNKPDIQAVASNNSASSANNANQKDTEKVVSNNAITPPILNNSRPDTQMVASNNSPSSANNVNQKDTEKVVSNNTITPPILNNTRPDTQAVVSNNSTNVPSNNTSSNPLDTVSSSANNNPTEALNNNTSTETVSADSIKVAGLEEDKQQLSNKASDATDYANDKMSQAGQMQERAEELAKNPQGHPDSIAILSYGAKKAQDKAVQAYKLAAGYKNQAASKQSDINKIEKQDPAVAQIAGDEAGDNSGDNSTAPTNPSQIIRQQAEQVQQDSVQLAQTNAEDTAEINSLQHQAEGFVADAGKTKDIQQRSALLQQADDLLKSKGEKQDEVKQNDVQIQQLHDEYVALTSKAQKADNASPASTNGAGNSDASLQQEIDAYAATANSDSAGNATAPANNNPNSQVAGNVKTSGSARHKISGHLKHPHQASNTQQPIVAANTVASNPAANNNSGNVTADNSITTNQNVPVNNASTVPSNNTANTTVRSNEAPPNQNIQTNNPVVATQEANTENTTAANNPTTSVSQTSKDSVAYYQTPDNTTLDSVSNANSKQGFFKKFSAKNTDKPADYFVANVEYDDTALVKLDEKSQKYLEAANTISNSVQKLRKQASAEPNKQKSETLYNKADSLDALAFQLNLKGNEINTEANTHQYSENAQKVKNIAVRPSNFLPFTFNNKVTAAQSIMHQADDSYQESLAEADSAGHTTVPAKKQQYMEAAQKDAADAILMQQDAVYLYFQADSLKERSTEKGNVYTDYNDNLKFNYTAFLQQGPAFNTSTNQAENNNSSLASNSKVEPTQPANTIALQPPGDASEQPENSNSQPQNNTHTESANTTTIQPPGDASAQPVSNISTQPEANDPPVQNAQKVNNVETLGAQQTASSKPIVATNPSVASNNDSPEGPSHKVKKSIAPDKPGSTASADTGSIFGDAQTSAYSAAKPIPINPRLPEGLIFGVQIGAFNNAIPPDLFKGFQPIMGLKTPQGLVRYIAGKYKSFDPARDAARKIRGMGYEGAFVVAFYNGKRITMKEAFEKLGLPMPVAPAENTQVAGGTNPATNNVPEGAGNNNSVGNAKPAIIAENTITPSKKELIDNKRRDIKAIVDTVPPQAISVDNIKGLVYTVQVGSFFTLKGFTRLRKIKQLYYWKDPNGTIKYNSGIYSNVADARAAKDIIVANSAVKDAFIAAYYNGQRITPAQAAALLNRGIVPEAASSGNEQTAAASNTTKPGKVTHPQVNENPTTSPEVSSPGLFADESKSNVIYSVRIASFTGKLPVDTVNKLLAYADTRIMPHKEDLGVTAYYAGVFPDYESAGALQLKFYKDGFHHAIVEAFYKGKKISLQEAKNIKNQ